MRTTLYATFDGEVFRPEGPVDVPPNTRVRITIDSDYAQERPASFLNTARSLKVDGPPDWSACLDDYLYGDRELP
jgi:hypothetical protein